MTSQTTTANDPVALIVPDETKTKFPDLVTLIIESRSMNNQERNYWLQVLPVMTEEQVSELRNILETEKNKLAEIEAQEGKKTSVTLSEEDIKQLEEEKRRKREEIQKAEAQAQTEINPDDILAQLN